MSGKKMNSQPAGLPELSILSNLRYDAPAGLVVFLVALPLCLGVALASKGTVDAAPLFSGILAGIIGGLVIPMISRSPLSVSGPAAGLIAIVAMGIDAVGSFEGFLTAVMLGGIVQILLGLARAGSIAYFFPNAVIKGMLAAIGLILIRKQLIHALGIDTEAVDDNFHLFETGSVIREVVVEGHYEMGAVVISVVSLALLLFWENSPLKKINFLPGALVVVFVSVGVNALLLALRPGWALAGGAEGHLVHLPESLVNNGLQGFFSELRLPDFSVLGSSPVYVEGLTIGIVASLETLLSVEAVDRLDPYKRPSPLNRELFAQGIGNTLAGLLGAIPVTAVIVRSSANVNAGGRTRMAAIIHGLLLLVSAVTIAGLLNLIPVAGLACILLLVGYKLTKPSLYKQMYRDGWNQFLPFSITIAAILLTDLLIGIVIGICVGIFFTIRANFKTAIQVKREGNQVTIVFRTDVSFLNKAILGSALAQVKPGDHVLIDGTKADFIDHDIQEMLREFTSRAKVAGIALEVRDVTPENAIVA